MSKKNKATQAAQAERDAKAALDSMMTAVTGNTNSTYTQADAQEEIEMDRRYKDATAALDAQADADAAKIRAERHALDSVPEINLDGLKASSFVVESHRTENALVTLNDAAQSLDVTTIRAKFAGMFNNQTLVDNLTTFEAAGLMETAAMPIMRVRAIARIKLDGSAMGTVKGSIIPDGSGKTYGSTKAPLSRFLQDVLGLRKQQMSEYMSVCDNCLIGDTLIDVFAGFSFTQLATLSRAKEPQKAAVYMAEYADRPSKEFGKILNEWETATYGNADSVADTDESSGQPDESAYPAFVYGAAPRMDAENAFHVVTDESDKPEIIRAPKASDAIDELRKRLNADENMTFRIPKVTYDALISRFKKAFGPYKPVGAVMSMYNGGYLFPEPFILAQVVTNGSAVTDETPKAAARRISRQGKLLEQWLTGNQAFSGMPNAADMPNAVTVYTDAKKRLDGPRMSAFDALKQAIDAVTLSETPNA